MVFRSSSAAPAPSESQEIHRPNPPGAQIDKTRSVSTRQYPQHREDPQTSQRCLRPVGYAKLLMQGEQV
jgi:hypothetical protein